MEQRMRLEEPLSSWRFRDTRINNLRLIHARWWVAVIVIVMTALCVHVLRLPLREFQLYALAGAIVAYNTLLYALTLRADRATTEREEVIAGILILQVVFDWLSMGVFMHFTGGITSPAVGMFITHLVLVTIALVGRPPYLYVIFIVLIVASVAALEAFGLLPHYAVIPGLDPGLVTNPLFIASQIGFLAFSLIVTIYLMGSIKRRLNERERQLNALLHTAHDTSASLQLDKVLATLAQSAAIALAAPGASIRVLDPSGEHLTIAASYGLSQTYLQKGPVEVSNSRMDQEALAGATIIVNQLAHDSRLQYPREMIEEGIQSILVVPVVGHKPLGVLRVYADVPDHFKERDADFLRAIAYQSAAAIENAVAYESLEQADAQRTQFVRQVTHELRAPVTGAQSLIRVMMNDMVGQVTPQQKDILQRLEHRMDALLELITDLLTLAASRSTHHDIEFSVLKLEPILHSVMDTFIHQAEEKQIALRLDAPLEPVLVYANEDGLKRIFSNLISNALKYTPAGGRITIEMAVQAGQVQVSVIDTGIGIPEDAVEKLGEEFFRAPNARHAGIPGTGLGMAIVRQYVSQFGGLLRIHSVEGEGTTMTVTLPVRSAAPASRPERSTHSLV